MCDLHFDLICCWKLVNYRPAIEGDEEAIQNVNDMFVKLDCEDGRMLLDMIFQMANRLLDYKFWLAEIKKYRRFRANFILPKALTFS
jgi:hypothetical protein